MMSTDEWLTAAAYRRTVYGLKDTSKVSKERVEDILKRVVSFAPSSYNTQPLRITLITGDRHKAFWDVIIKAIAPTLKKAGEDVFKQMSEKLASHKKAHGAVLFWVSGDVIAKSAEDHKSAANFFPMYGQHSAGMAQIMVWTALELEGLGANLQHVGALPDVEDAVKKFCNVPEDYALTAHLNYGDKAQDHPPMPEKLPFGETINVMD